MATLTDAEKVKIRNAIARKAATADIPIRWGKAAINAAAQAVEDLLVSSAVTISNAIDAATVGPYGITFTAAEKKWIVAWALSAKFDRDKV